jgi:hypothetical protein
MGLFQKSNPETQLVNKLEAKTTERDKLRARLSDAEAAVIAADSAAVELASQGADDASLDAAEAKQRAMSHRVSTLKTALAMAEADVAALEHDLAARRDTVERAATAAQIEQMAVNLELMVPQFQTLFDKTISIAGLAAASQVWDAAGLQNYATASRTQIPAAYELVARSLRERATRVLDGRSPAKLVEPDAPRPVVTVKEPVTRRLFATRNVCWADDAGQVKTAGKYNTVDLPPATAARALASDYCREIGSDLWKAWGNTKALSTPPAAECTSLDADGGAAADATITPSDPQFTLVDRGPPITLHIAKEA